MTPDRIVTDTSLAEVARRLSFLGYDVTTLRGGRLEELFEMAHREGRVVLTTSPRRPRRWAEVRAIVVSRGDPATAVRAVASALSPATAPFSRCPRCNVALQRRSAFEAVGEVPGRVTRRVAALQQCPDCGQWFWDGTHVARIRAWLERTLGRPVDGPGGAAGPEAPRR